MVIMRFRPCMRPLLLALLMSTCNAFRAVQNVDFIYCYNHIVKNLNTSDLTDPLQYFRFNPATGERIDPNLPLLSLQGCEEKCHDGFELWTVQDTVARFITWLVPVIVLISHYHFAPLGAENMFAAILHLIGDPIDSIWSMLTRQEANRRFYRRAAQSKLFRGHAVATIWSAYDEHGWQDASTHFFESLRNRENESEPTQSRSASRSATSSPSHASASISGSPRPKKHPKWKKKADQPQDISFKRHLDETEMYLIEVAAQRITSNRTDSQLQTWVAILSLLGALGGAYIRTLMSRENNQTSHTIAVVALMFIFISLVKISGNIGSFTSSTAVLDIIQELRRNLKEHDKKIFPDRESLFPAFNIHKNLTWDPMHPKAPESTNNAAPETDQNTTQTVPALSMRSATGDIDLETGNGRTRPSIDFDQEPLVTNESNDSKDFKNVNIWPSVAPYLGMNSHFRPVKLITTQDSYDNSDRSWFALYAISFLIVMGGSFTPAILLAYFTPLKGFGCRSLAWTLVAAFWFLSSLSDFFLQSHFKLARKLWRVTILKDSFVAVWFVGSILTAQIGFFNSCWCRSGQMTPWNPVYVNLNPLSDSDWLEGWKVWLATPAVALAWIFFFIWLVGNGDKNARDLLNRSLDQRYCDIIRNNATRTGLEIQPPDDGLSSTARGKRKAACGIDPAGNAQPSSSWSPPSRGRSWQPSSKNLMSRQGSPGALAHLLSAEPRESMELGDMSSRS